MLSKYSTYLTVDPLTILSITIHTWFSNVSEIDATLLTFDSFSSVVVNLTVSELSTVNNPVPAGVVSKTVTIAAAGFATVKSAWVLIAV